MVSISLYRGNLHKVPDVTRKYLMPARKISLKDFKTLLRRRSRALSRLKSTTTDPKNNCPHHQNSVEVENNDCVNNSVKGLKSVEEEVEKGIDNDGIGCGGVEELVEATESLVVEVKGGGVDDDVAKGDQEVEREVEGVVVGTSGLEIAKKEEDVSDKQKRRQEIEEKLKILNAKKHGLVQALKQIINAEEELKRRSNTQGVSGQPPVGGGQVEGTHDSGSMSRDNTPRMGSEGNGSGEAEGAETDVAKHNVHLHHLVRTSSISPSSDTQQHKSPFTKATLPSRTNSGIANSPSRFALAGQQGLPPNLPSVSVSGTNYIASSPSPAASGGTSAFRDGRGPSPWN